MVIRIATPATGRTAFQFPLTKGTALIMRGRNLSRNKGTLSPQSCVGANPVAVGAYKIAFVDLLQYFGERAIVAQQGGNVSFLYSYDMIKVHDVRRI